MHPTMLAILTFLAVVLTVGGVYSVLADLFLRDRARVQERLDVEFRGRQKERAKASLLLKDLNLAGAEALEGAQETVLTWQGRLREMLDQSGLEMSVGRLLGYCAASALLTGLVGGLLMRRTWVGLVCLLPGAVVPLLYVRAKRNARKEAIRRSLADAFDLMARILRAGQSMAQAMQGVADEFPAPISDEFAFSSEQQNLGLAPEISLRDLARRTGVIEISIFVVAVVVQRQVGGNLSEILEKLAEVVRQRYRLRGTIRSLTAEGRLQAVVLMALPPLLFVIMLIVNPDYARILLQHPGLLGGMVFFQILGALWIRKIVSFEF